MLTCFPTRYVIRPQPSLIDFEEPYGFIPGPSNAQLAARPHPTLQISTEDSNGSVSIPVLSDNRRTQICEEEECGRGGSDISFCNVCKMSFCDRCWNRQAPHRRNRAGPGNIPHEKTSHSVAEKVNRAFEPPTDDPTREQLYRDDEVTAWMGIDRPDDGSKPLLQDYGRYGDLMTNTEKANSGSFSATLPHAGQGWHDTRTPHLISFVGQTGAGKSTLIKLVIDFMTNETEEFPTPVVGASGAHVPTSEDVHLYLDPRTAYTDTPILYADCEGLEGGEQEPVGAKFRKKRRKAQSRDSRDVPPTEHQLSRAARVVSERELTWADNPRTQSRQFVVINLYPRLLYTFSDVIVFVLKNPR